MSGKGVEASAFTQIHGASAMLSNGRLKMSLNRPFLVTVTTWEGMPLFMAR